MDLPFVKKFDIRGEYGVDFTDRDAYYIARALAKTFPIKRLLIGWDTRPSSRNIAMSICNALKDTPISISYLDTVPIEYVTAASCAMGYDVSIMCTGSHHPYTWTGLLIHTKNGESIEDKQMEAVLTGYKSVLSDEYINGTVDVERYTNALPEVERIYEKKLRSIIPLDRIREFNIVVDLGDGSGGKALSVLERLLPQVKVTRIHDRGIYDAISTHRADPSEIANMQDLINEVTGKGYYDAGFAFDSDADRVLAVSSTGEYLNGSLLGGAMMKTLTAYLKLDDKRFGYAVECGPSVYNAFIALREGVHVEYSLVPVPVGRSITRNELRKGNLDFSVESVGHFYASDFFKTDSSIFSIMLLLVWMSSGNALSDLSKSFTDGQRMQSTDDLGSYLDRHPLYLYQDFAKLFPHTRKYEVDGFRGEAFNDDGEMIAWFALRHSGYDKLEKYYYGSIDDDDLTKLTAIFSGYLEMK